jgi:hypothetical protein
VGRLRIIILTIFATSGLLALWYWADSKDYFRTNYSNLAEKEELIFKWRDGDDGEKLMNRYRQHFNDTTFIFPRQSVRTIKCFKNIPMLGIFTSRTLKRELNVTFIKFCNDTASFDWRETTWSKRESEFYVLLYDSRDKVIGKIYFCLRDCGMTDARPLCPAMKFGGLSKTGRETIEKLFNDKSKWE